MDHRQHVLLEEGSTNPYNIRTELKQSNTGSKGRLRKDLLHTKSAYTRCGVNQKLLMEKQDVVLSRIRYLRMVSELREAGYTDETYVHTLHKINLFYVLNMLNLYFQVKE